MKTFILGFTIWVAMSGAAFTRIGDNETQIESVYGKAAKVLHEEGNHKQVGYSAGAIAVVVDFVNGFSRREGFAKPNTAMLTDDEIQQILNVSAAENTTWKEEPGKAGDRKWKRSDNKAEAFLPGRQTYLVVQDVKFVPPEQKN